MSAENNDAPVENTAPAEASSNKNEELPQWAKEEIKSLREEAARRRVQHREATEALTKLQEELVSLKDSTQTLESQKQQFESELLKYKVAIDSGIPGESVADFTELLTGNTAEEIQAQAEKLQKHWAKPQEDSTPAVDHAQGYGAGGAGTPEADFAAWLKGQLN